MPNHLANEDSLYLRQHADNPVDWYPWGEEAFVKARRENKPVIVSIGYSSCHWCHVMAHESFEDSYIADLMNAHFVCVKVDREERPEIDQIYMDAVQMLNGQGGWPLNVFCLPDGRPFAGGTYFPPDDRSGHNMVPWPQLLMRIVDFYGRQREDLEQNARAIIANLQSTNTPGGTGGEEVLGPELYLRTSRRLMENADLQNGGFGGAPKFPPSMNLAFLLAMRGSETVEAGDRGLIRDLDTVNERTLLGMARGGIFDQIGGGFARYSVDAHWRIPHFEKMLYDNALLIDIYSRTAHRNNHPLLAKIVGETLSWLDREMSSAEGPYYSALDADAKGGEGSTYLWTPGEVQSVLDRESADQFCAAYGITPEGNFENTGKSNPVLQTDDISVRNALDSVRTTLLEARQKRPQPARDNKFLTAWNALLAQGMARAAFTFDRPDWLLSARKICDWIWSAMRYDENRLWAVSYGNGGRENGKLDDYAYSASAFLALSAVVDWQYPGESAIWLTRAIALTDAANRHFKDPSGPGYYYISDDHEILVHRKKDWYDNATPSGNSVMVHVLSTLEALTGESRYPTLLHELKSVYPAITTAAPGATSHALEGFVHQAVGIAVIRYRMGANLETVRQRLSARPWRPVFFLPAEKGQPSEYQLCVGTRCLAPTDSATEIADML